MTEKAAKTKGKEVEHEITVDVFISLEEQKQHALEKASKKFNNLDISQLKVLETTQRQAASGGGMFCKIALVSKQ